MSALNLADWAVDGSKIEIPARQSAKPAPTPTPLVIVKEVVVTPPQNAPAGSEAPAANAESMPGAPLDALSRGSASKTPQNAPEQPESPGKSAPETLAALRKNPVDINRASAEQLSALPGVGPKMAERILVYRRENGGFKSVADLDNVKGIGEKRMETLKDLVKIR